jgi:hypothetical protein
VQKDVRRESRDCERVLHDDDHWVNAERIEVTGGYV